MSNNLSNSTTQFGFYDCTGHIGTLESDARWPMFSFERPANILWNAIAGQLYKQGWTDEDIKNWLQSKNPRHELDGKLGDDIEKLGRKFAKTISRD